MTLKFDRWPWHVIGHLSYVTKSFVHHFVARGLFKLELQSRKKNLGENWHFFVPFDLEIWQMTLKNNRAPLLHYFKMCASFHSHLWIKTAVTVRKCPNLVKIGYVLSCVTLKFNKWPWKTIGHISYATSSLVHHFVTIRELRSQWKQLNWVLTSVTLTFDPWLWYFAWISLLSIVITPENFMMIWWEEHRQ